VLLKYTEQLFHLYRELEFDINQLNQEFKGNLRIGASTTIAQYVLPPVLADFHHKFKDIKISLTINNTETIERLLEQKEIDLGLIEGFSRNRLFHYIPFLKDEIVLVARAAHPLAQKGIIKTDQLKEASLLFREPGSGTLDIIAQALKEQGIKISDLPIEMQLGNTESIKSYLLHADALAFLSLHAVSQELKTQTLHLIEVKNLHILRDFYFIQPQGNQAAVANLFLNFIQRYNFK